MLYFSKLKIVIIYSIIVILSLFSFTNFFDNEENFLLSKNINLGLDLQGGSYLLLEVDSQPVIKQKLQSKIISLRKIFKEKKVKFKNLKLKNNTINFQLSKDDTIKFEEFFINKNNTINDYYTQYRSYEMDHSIENLSELSAFSDLISIKYSN